MTMTTDLETKISTLNRLYKSTLTDLQVLYDRYGTKEFGKGTNHAVNPVDAFCEEIIEEFDESYIERQEPDKWDRLSGNHKCNTRDELCLTFGLNPENKSAEELFVNDLKIAWETKKFKSIYAEMLIREIQNGKLSDKEILMFTKNINKFTSLCRSVHREIKRVLEACKQDQQLRAVKTVPRHRMASSKKRVSRNKNDKMKKMLGMTVNRNLRNIF